MVCHDWFKILIKWILFFIVPSLAGTFLFISSKYAWEIATSGWQIFLAIVFLILWIIYEIASFIILVKQTRECFE